MTPDRTSDPTRDRAPSPGPALPRRTVLRGVAVLGAAGATVGLAGCGGDEPATTTGSGSGSGEGSGPGPGAAAGAIKTADVPVGGGAVVGAVVVTQPAAGTFKAFTAKCTHQGCAVNKVENGVIQCPCHGSRFSAEDGSVMQGPATAPLAEKKVTVSGDSLTVA